MIEPTVLDVETLQDEYISAMFQLYQANNRNEHQRKNI